MKKVHQLSVSEQFFMARKFVGNPIGTLSHFMEKHDSVFALRPTFAPSQNVIVTQNPDHIQHVLQKNHRNYRKTEAQKKTLASQLGRSILTTDGPYWKQQRRLMQPGFHRERIQALSSTMLRETNSHVDNLKSRLGQTINMSDEMMQLTFRVIYKTIFSDSVTNEELEEFAGRLDELHHYVITQLRKPYLLPWYKITGKIKYFDQLKKDQDDKIFEIITERRASKEQQNDLLEMLLQSRYEDSGEGMNDQQIRDELTTINVAGHETSANALTWALYLLADHPEVVDKMLKEYEDVLGESAPSFTTIPQLTYAKQVINEAMRLYPPAWIVDRMANEDDQLGEFAVPKDTVILLFIYGNHRNKNYWIDNQKFDPDRFSPENIKAQHKYAFAPFGGGPRLCIGQSFAQMEMQIILCQLIRNFKFELAQEAPKLEPLVTLRPKGGIKMKVTARS